ncbi:L-galactonate transporter [Planctomycetes bacterium Pan216]|uniref:L-galactonate transporter n=1 Tax=Kolteria novifilia TaxID=2527975 RepID=A0A518B096_9BACT|nr:L-galactonate transporter [Planctomycetes bacterium Pan216]
MGSVADPSPQVAPEEPSRVGKPSSPGNLGSESPSSRPPAVALLTLIVISVAVNYIDRGALSVSNPLIESEFGLTKIHQGLLLSAFFWTYALAQIPAGWLVDRFNVKWVYAIGYAVWSVATALTGFVGNFGLLLSTRLVLGVGESVAYPATSRIISENIPEQRRGLANALVDAGSKIGPGLSTLIGGLMVEQFGWRALFIGLGVGGLFWLIPWFLVAPSPSSLHALDDDKGREPAASSRPSLGQLLVRRDLWGTSVGMFTLGYTWYFILTWLPTYLVEQRGLDLGRMAVAASLPLFAMAATTVLAGWTADWLIAQGRSVTMVRKGFAVTGLALAGIMLFPVTRVETVTSCVALIVGACSALGLYTANVWAMTQTIAGPKASGRWSGIQNAIGNMGGVVSPMLTGFIVYLTGSFGLAFTVAAGVLGVGIFSYLALVGQVAPIDWSEEGEAVRC